MQAPHFLAPRQLTKHRSLVLEQRSSRGWGGPGRIWKDRKEEQSLGPVCLGKRMDAEFVGKWSHLTSPGAPPGSGDLAEDKAPPSWNKPPLLTPEGG